MAPLWHVDGAMSSHSVPRRCRRGASKPLGWPVRTPSGRRRLSIKIARHPRSDRNHSALAYRDAELAHAHHKPARRPRTARRPWCRRLRRWDNLATGSSSSTTVGIAGGNLGTPGVIIDANDQNKFVPETENVTVGEIIEWKNVGKVAHNIVFADADAQSLNDPVLASGGVWEVKFTQAGTYNYTCTIHIAMDGTIVVGSS